jgi:hypothetical protein
VISSRVPRGQICLFRYPVRYSISELSPSTFAGYRERAVPAVLMACASGRRPPPPESMLFGAGRRRWCCSSNSVVRHISSAHAIRATSQRGRVAWLALAPRSRRAAGRVSRYRRRRPGVGPETRFSPEPGLARRRAGSTTCLCKRGSASPAPGPRRAARELDPRRSECRQRDRTAASRPENKAIVRRWQPDT